MHSAACPCTVQPQALVQALNNAEQIETSCIAGLCQRVRGGSAKLKIRSPPRRPRSPPPDATVTNSSPFTMYTAGDEKMPAPVLNFHKRSPLFASYAKK